MAVRPIERGPLGRIDALRQAIGPDGTLVMPSWPENDDELFDPLNAPAPPDLGVTGDMFWRLPGVLRSDHSFAFAAYGPRAREILADPLPLPPHIHRSPVGRVYDLDGKVLPLGAGTTLIRHSIWRRSWPAFPIACHATAPCFRTGNRNANIPERRSADVSSSTERGLPRLR